MNPERADVYFSPTRANASETSLKMEALMIELGVKELLDSRPYSSQTTRQTRNYQGEKK